MTLKAHRFLLIIYMLNVTMALKCLVPIDSLDFIMEYIQYEYDRSLKDTATGFSSPLVVNQNCNPTLYREIHNIAQLLNVPPPHYIYIERNDGINKLLKKIGIDYQFNAYVTKWGYATTLYIGGSLLYVLTYKELRAVIAHELGHIKHNHITQQQNLWAQHLCNSYLIMECLQIKNSPYSRLLNILTWPSFVISQAIQIIFLKRKSKQHEKEADLESLKFMKDKDPLINAIKKIEYHAGVDSYKPSFLEKLFCSHPTKEERAAFLSEETHKLFGNAEAES